MIIRSIKNTSIFGIALFLFSLLLACGQPAIQTENKKDNSNLLAKNSNIEKVLTRRYAGTYSFGDDIEKGAVGSVIIYPLSDSTVMFYLDICLGAPSYNLGQLFGQIEINNNIGIYSQFDEDSDRLTFRCFLKFEFNSDELKITTEYGDCGFGASVYADNTYKLVDKSLPKYFITGEGDTILFKGLTLEEFAHRND